MISQARLKERKKVNCDRVRIALREIKGLMRGETDREIKIILAEAGMLLNKLLVK